MIDKALRKVVFRECWSLFMNYSNKTLLFLLCYMFTPLMAIGTLTRKSATPVALIASSIDLSQSSELPENLETALNTLNKFYVSIWSKKKNKDGEPKINPDLIDPILPKFRQLSDILFIIHLKYQDLGQEIPDSVINTFLGQDPRLPKNKSLLARLFADGISAIFPMVTKKYPADDSISAINQFALTALNNIIIKHEDELSEREAAFFRSLLKKYGKGGPKIEFKALELMRAYLKIDPKGGTPESRRKFFRTILFQTEREKFDQQKQALEGSLNSVTPPQEDEAPTTEVETVALSESDLKQIENHKALLLVKEKQELERKAKIKQAKKDIINYAQKNFSQIHHYLTNHLVDEDEKAQSLLDTLLKEVESKKNLKK